VRCFRQKRAGPSIHSRSLIQNNTAHLETILTCACSCFEEFSTNDRERPRPPQCLARTDLLLGRPQSSASAPDGRSLAAQSIPPQAFVRRTVGRPTVRAPHQGEPNRSSWARRRTDPLGPMQIHTGSCCDKPVPSLSKGAARMVDPHTRPWRALRAVYAVVVTKVGRRPSWPGWRTSRRAGAWPVLRLWRRRPPTVTPARAICRLDPASRRERGALRGPAPCQ
jgi:hypothetical protein